MSLAAERVLILLQYAADNPDGLGVREAGRQLGHSPATIHRLITALSNQGFVVRDELTERYQLGPEAVRLGLTALSRLGVRQVARQDLERLSSASGETALLGVARGNQAVYIDKAVCNRDIRIDAPIGAERAYNCTAVGKVLLSGMTRQELEHLAAEGAFQRSTEHSIIDVEALAVELEQIRDRGWAFDGEEYRLGICCVAAPIHDHQGRVVAAVTVTGPAPRIRERLEFLGVQVVDHAGTISAKLGYGRPGN